MRPKNIENYRKCLNLRKQGLSYTEILRHVPLTKSTLANWFRLAGLTTTKEHFEIQRQKRLENWQSGVLASNITKQKKRNKAIEEFILSQKGHLRDPLFICGIIAYEAEGCKDKKCSFFNSDYRLVSLFITFAETYFNLDRLRHMSYRIYVHETRKQDLKRIKQYWATKLFVPQDIFKISWKRNVVKHRRTNQDYVGQMAISIHTIPFAAKKILAASDIILKDYCRVV